MSKGSEGNAVKDKLSSSYKSPGVRVGGDQEKEARNSCRRKGGGLKNLILSKERVIQKTGGGWEEDLSSGGLTLCREKKEKKYGYENWMGTKISRKRGSQQKNLSAIWEGGGRKLPPLPKEKTICQDPKKRQGEEEKGKKKSCGKLLRRGRKGSLLLFVLGIKQKMGGRTGIARKLGKLGARGFRLKGKRPKMNGGKRRGQEEGTREEKQTPISSRKPTLWSLKRQRLKATKGG